MLSGCEMRRKLTQPDRQRTGVHCESLMNSIFTLGTEALISIAILRF